ncbi:hypothetical protein C8R45DRAFT_599853 [Mycena sanguinolenta]|nr:hypothetical protein C8R45DRAFT_599853 [Mycena sanguinolenta]
MYHLKCILFTASSKKLVSLDVSLRVATGFRSRQVRGASTADGVAKVSQYPVPAPSRVDNVHTAESIHIRKRAVTKEILTLAPSSIFKIQRDGTRALTSSLIPPLQRLQAQKFQALTLWPPLWQDVAHDEIVYTSFVVLKLPVIRNPRIAYAYSLPYAHKLLEFDLNSVRATSARRPVKFVLLSVPVGHGRPPRIVTGAKYCASRCGAIGVYSRHTHRRSLA